MRFLIVLLSLILCAPDSLSVHTEKVPTPLSYGNRYVSLKKWAAAKGFRVNWRRGAETVVLTNRWATLTFTLESRKATINGTLVWLSLNVTASKDILFIGEKDVETLLDPILFPPKLPQGRKIRTIAISPGHGGKDPGYFFNNQQEKKYTLLLAKEVERAFAGTNLKTVMIRDSDEYISPEDQASHANRVKADLFVTVHYNAAQEIEAKGLEVYCLTPEGASSTNGGAQRERSPGNKNDKFNALLAYQMQKSILRDMDMNDRGVKRAAFLVLRFIDMPGLLIEGGFMTNPSDSRKIYDPASRRKMARAIVDGVLAYKRLVER